MCGEVQVERTTLQMFNETDNISELKVTPVGYIKDIGRVVTNLLDQYEEQGQLTWHDGQIQDDEIWIKLGGDHGSCSKLAT